MMSTATTNQDVFLNDWQREHQQQRQYSDTMPQRIHRPVAVHLIKPIPQRASDLYSSMQTAAAVVAELQEETGHASTMGAQQQQPSMIVEDDDSVYNNPSLLLLLDERSTGARNPSPEQDAEDDEHFFWTSEETGSICFRDGHDVFEQQRMNMISPLSQEEEEEEEEEEEVPSWNTNKPCTVPTSSLPPAVIRPIALRVGPSPQSRTIRPIPRRIVPPTSFLQRQRDDNSLSKRHVQPCPQRT
jgi:hypothetical protein